MLKTIFPLALVGTISGAVLYDVFSNQILMKIFSIFLIIMAIKSLLLDKLTIIHLLRQPLIFVGGIMQGIYGIGGPFTLLATKDLFASKSMLRSSLATYFIFFNLVRIVQFQLTGVMDYTEIFEMWWLIFPIFVAVFLGYIIHIKISEEIFKKVLNILLLFAGIVFMLR